MRRARMTPMGLPPRPLMPEAPKSKLRRRVLAIDIGGSHVKARVSSSREVRQFESGPHLTPRQMVAQVHRLSGDWTYDVVSIGYPGVVVHGKIVAEPHNLAVCAASSRHR